jgi:DNA-binding NarL/FixJ family response regulator
LIRVIVADDSAELQEILKSNIEVSKEIEVIGTVGDGYQALSQCEITLPDLVLMDVNMPECDGIKGTKLIKIRFPFIKVLLMTGAGIEPNLANELHCGADGYLIKNFEADKLQKGINNTFNGLTTIEKELFIP